MNTALLPNLITNLFQDPFSQEIWVSTYKDHKDVTLSDTFRRVANHIASAELTPEKRLEWAGKFYEMLSNFKVVPGGRISANAGTEWKGTTFLNCYVGPLPDQDLDSLDGIYKVLIDQANTLKSEGGWGMDFSWIRPRGSFIDGIGVESPGSVKFMELFDKSSEIVTAGSGKKSSNAKAKGKIRKGAMMATLSVSHPDIVEFITAKQTPGRLSKFNMSVNCTKEFMDKVNSIKDTTGKLNYAKSMPKSDVNDIYVAKLEEELVQFDTWDLKFPDTKHSSYKKEWRGRLGDWEAKGYSTIVHATVKVQWLWNLIMESTYNRAEPGVMFLDRANDGNPLSYAEKILSTNPSMPAGTLIHVKEGIFPIEKLQDKSFKVKSLDGVWADAKCFLSSESEPILEFGIGNLKSIRSTKQHRWPVYDQRMDRLYKVYAEDLKEGDLIPSNRNERIGIYGDMTLTRDEGFLVGYLIGDGWFNVRKDDTSGTLIGGITFGKHELLMAEKVKSIAEQVSGKKYTLAEKEAEYYFQFGSKDFSDILRNRYKLLPGVKDIPDSVWTSNDNYTEGFIDGLLSADGHVHSNGKFQSIQLTTSRESLGFNFAKLLSFAGVNSSIYHSTTSDVSFPNGKNYDKEYKRWDVKVSGNNLVNFYNVFSITHTDKCLKLEEAVNVVVSKTRYQRSKDFVEIESITETAPEKVWDISVEHTQHVFPSEWCYSGNCGEQTLPEAGCCDLGSLNLTQYVLPNCSGFDIPSIKRDVGYLVRFLDNVNTISDAPLPGYKYSMEHKRRVGCGVLGWGSALFMMKVRFGSEAAGVIREEMMSTYARAAYEASIDLAEEKGMFSLCQPEKHAVGLFVQDLGLSPEYMSKLLKFGIRNSALLSEQPTGNGSIYANIVSGGLEPIFMPEYNRTTICPTIPDSIKDVTPNYPAGVFEETSLFKFAKEGDEDILKGVGPDGITYKIDRNRGLTKEVLCEDYGVRFLKAKGEWDPKADYAVTTTELTVEDHLNDLKGFARWVDSACSKTINIPNNYPYEAFKEIYTDAYATGKIKGLTTYRSGTMTSVLSAKEEFQVVEGEEEIILDDIKLPDSLPATLKTLRAEKRKWYVTVIQDETQTRPVAMFVQTNDHEKTIIATDAVEKLLALARAKGIPEKHVASVETKIAGDNNPAKICRTISLCLRHGILIRSIVATLEKVDCIVGSFVFHIRKFLASFIKDGEKVLDEKCGECGSTNVVYSEGCKICSNCGSSKCG